MRSGESLVAMTPDQIKQIIAEEVSNRRGATITVLASALILGTIGWLWVKYHPEQNPNTETHGTTDKAVAKPQQHGTRDTAVKGHEATPPLSSAPTESTPRVPTRLA
jgi:cytoskeletal protein RodZ